MHDKIEAPLNHLLQYPLLNAIFGRRARRFGQGMEIPSGPLAFKSRQPPHPLSELERAVLLAAGTGVTGWSFGVPFGPDRPREHAHYTLRFTGRTAPTAGGFGTPVMLVTDDEGLHVTNTRDITPERIREFDAIENDAERIIAVTRAHTVKLSDVRLDSPSAPPHMLEPNLWMANAPGSTLFMPDRAMRASRCWALLAMAVSQRQRASWTTRPGGPPATWTPFVRSGLLARYQARPVCRCSSRWPTRPICSELAFMAHNVVLTMQAMGLGGLYFNGLNRWSILGAFAERRASRASAFASCATNAGRYRTRSASTVCTRRCARPITRTCARPWKPSWPASSDRAALTIPPFPAPGRAPPRSRRA